MISISDELNNKLKDSCGNVSLLIERLLRDYFKLESQEVKAQREEDEKLKAKMEETRSTVYTNYFVNNPVKTEEDLKAYLDNCSDSFRIRCGLPLKIDSGTAETQI